MKELFPDSILGFLNEKEGERSDHLKDLEGIIIDHYRILHEQIKPKNDKEIKSYENKIDLLQKKKKDYSEFSKLEFYEQKVTSLKKLTGELEEDWQKIVDQMKVL